MLKKTITLFALLLVSLALGIIFSYTTLKETPLFGDSTALWALIGVIIAGLVSGAARGLLKKKAVIQGNEVVRHGLGSFLSHWGTVLGIFTLIASGILLGFLGVNPLAGTLASVIPATNMHYFALILTLFCGSFFVADYTASWDWPRMVPNIQDIMVGFIGKFFLHKQWDKEDKYLSSQKAAFAPVAIIGLVMIATGAIKVAAHIWHLLPLVVGWATVIHDAFFILMLLYVVVHVAIVLLMGHWPAFLSFFTGEMSTRMVEKDYPLWYEKLKIGTEKK
jgi:cytochrome b subunit of formate dehydrogenase